MENKQVKENKQQYVENHFQFFVLDQNGKDTHNDEFTKAFYQALSKKLGNY